jgi:hypothetical protein
MLTAPTAGATTSVAVTVTVAVSNPRGKKPRAGK